ncbi:MAG: electron transport complex subunit RsxE [Xanthomonadales bacterium]|nr:electron transport complex subunit RsxE [Xanthomonadales bacterium]
MSATLAPALRATDLVGDGLWRRNVGLVQLLGLCPLLAVSGTAVHALGLGLASMLCLTVTAACVSALRGLAGRDVRIPLFVMIIASVVTATELLMHAFLPALHAVLGIFVPLIVTNCALMARAESFASKHRIGPAMLDGFAMGLGFLLVLLVLGCTRELLGRGSLFAGAGALLHLPWLSLQIDGYRGPLLFVLPPGAFLVLAALIAAKQSIDLKRAGPP